ncbi:MAG: 6-phosphogluconolactonase, partial [Ginsengibacter sp.]
MNKNIYDTTDHLCEGMATWLTEIISATLKQQEFFTMALSGGNTPKQLYKKLASEAFREKINWQRVHIFWGDERVVPFTDDRNNAKMAFDNLLEIVNVPRAQIHEMRTDIEPIFAANEYQDILETYFENTGNSFDLVLLGLGDDGHTLSLFPKEEIREEQHKWVSAVYNREQEMYRITLLPSIVNRSSYIAFMVTGKSKSYILQKVLDGPYDPYTLPAQIINPIHG